MKPRKKTIVGLEILLWWALLVGVWDLTLSATTLPELCAAAAAGLVSAIVAVAARRALGGRWRAEVRWLRWLPVWTASVAIDTLAAFRLAARHLRDRDVHGDFGDVVLVKPRAAAADAHRALATLTLSSTPASMVYDADPQGHRLLVHTIVDVRPDLEGVVSR